jgi:hypothetical protein
MKRKIGLVIQGALTSVGRTGDKLHQRPDQLKKEGGVVEYDCRENIQKIIDNFGHLFDEIVVSVFDNQLREGDGWRGARIVSAPDPGGIKQAGHYKDSNKKRQFLSTLNGINALEKSGIEYVVKTRTDTYLDFEKLLESFFAGNTEKIGATVVHPRNFLLHDLYFVAKFDKLKKFSQAILAYDGFEFIPSVHRDMILKHAHAEYKGKIGVPEWAYFPNFPPDGVSDETRKIFNYMFENIYFSLDPEVWKSTLWRGTYFAPDHFTSLLGPENQKQRKYDLPALITTDWARYFHFRQEISGERISWLDKVIIKIGQLGWDLWNLARRMVRYIHG